MVSSPPLARDLVSTGPISQHGPRPELDPVRHCGPCLETQLSSVDRDRPLQSLGTLWVPGSLWSAWHRKGEGSEFNFGGIVN